MREPRTARDYADRGVQAVTSVLVELGQVLGAWRGRFVVIGGAVPWLLLPAGSPPHVGTLDVDLALDPEALESPEYASFIEALEQAGYARGLPHLKPFQLQRLVEVDEGEPVAVVVDLMMPREAKTKKNRPPLVSGLRVQGADGVQVALDHSVAHLVEGRMPDGRQNSVELLVATIPALLVMKGHALAGRDKPKDAYDTYYSVRNFDGGPEALAAACIPLLDDPIAKRGFRHIASKFTSREDFGPLTVRRFLTDSGALGGMTPGQVQLDAYEQVRRFLELLGVR